MEDYIYYNDIKDWFKLLARQGGIDRVPTPGNNVRYGPKGVNVMRLVYSSNGEGVCVWRGPSGFLMRADFPLCDLVVV